MYIERKIDFCVKHTDYCMFVAEICFRVNFFRVLITSSESGVSKKTSPETSPIDKSDKLFKQELKVLFNLWRGLTGQYQVEKRYGKLQDQFLPRRLYHGFTVNTDVGHQYP